MDRPSLGAASNSLKRNYRTTMVKLLYSSWMKKISCALDHKTPWSLFLSRKVTLPRGAKSHIKNVLGLALYFYYLFDTNSTYVLNWAFLNTLELEIRESQDLVKDFRRTARGWKGNKAIRKKIYKFKKLKQYKEIKQNYNNQKED